MKQTTLCLLVKGEEVLLGMKKRGFGEGKWNGFGGKLDAKKGDKNILDALLREVEEESGIKIKNPEQVAAFRFYFPHKPEWNQHVHLFLVKEWVGVPEESEEMAPRWFKFHEIPYDQMWEDDKHWLPHVLKGKKLKGDFVFREEGGVQIIHKHDIRHLA